MSTFAVVVGVGELRVGGKSFGCLQNKIVQVTN